jgi:hypothetical protein
VAATSSPPRAVAASLRRPAQPFPSWQAQSRVATAPAFERHRRFARALTLAPPPPAGCSRPPGGAAHARAAFLAAGARQRVLVCACPASRRPRCAFRATSRRRCAPPARARHPSHPVGPTRAPRQALPAPQFLSRPPQPLTTALLPFFSPPALRGDDGRSGGSDGLIDTLITVVFGGALLLSAAYTLASFATGGPAGALAARPFALPAASLLVLAKYFTNALIWGVETLCAVLYLIPSAVAIPVSIALIALRYNLGKREREAASDKFARENPGAVAAARARMISAGGGVAAESVTSAAVAANATSLSMAGVFRGAGATAVAAPAPPGARVPASVVADDGAAEQAAAKLRFLKEAEQAAAARDAVLAKAASDAAVAATVNATAAAQMQQAAAQAAQAAAAAAEVEQAAQVRSTEEARAAAAQRAAEAAAARDAAAQRAAAAQAEAAEAAAAEAAAASAKRAAAASNAARQQVSAASADAARAAAEARAAADFRAAAIAKAKAELKAKAGEVSAAAGKLGGEFGAVPSMTDVSTARLPPFFGAAPSPAAAAAAAKAQSVVPEASGTVKVKGPRNERMLSDLSLVELGALATQLVVADALAEATKGTISIVRPRKPAAAETAAPAPAPAKAADVKTTPTGTVARGPRKLW